MIQKPTTFITGAGASHEFGYPTGSKLIRELQDDISKSNDSIGALYNQSNPSRLNFTWNKKEVNEFRLKLRRSNPASIDSFIANNEKYREIAQFYITFKLLISESGDSIYENQNTYLEFIWHTMLDGVLNINDFLLNNVTFVTFNYDRSLEHFFTTTISNYFTNEDPAQIKKAIDLIKIVHLYGDLNAVNTLNSKSNLYIEYGEKPNLTHTNIEKIFTLSSGVSLLHDPENARFIDAFSIFKKTQQIFVLGFGFEEKSFDKLQIHNLDQETKIISSCLGLSTAKKRKIEEKLAHHKQRLTNGPTFEFDKADKLYTLLSERLISL